MIADWNIHCYFTDHNSQSHFALAKHLGPEGKIKNWSWQVFFQIWFILYSKNSKNDPGCAIILLALPCKLGIFDIRQKRQSYEKDLSQKEWWQFLPILKKYERIFYPRLTMILIVRTMLCNIFRANRGYFSFFSCQGHLQSSNISIHDVLFSIFEGELTCSKVKLGVY